MGEGGDSSLETRNYFKGVQKTSWILLKNTMFGKYQMRTTPKCRTVWKRRWPINPEDPSDKLLKILAIGSRSITNDIEFVVSIAIDSNSIGIDAH